jgi:hypothetical protein
MPGVDESSFFVVPSEVVEELRAGGFVRSAIDKAIVTESVDVGSVVLVVYNTAASTITLFQTPSVVRALAMSLVKWFRREGPASDKFELAARGPHGYMVFSSDEVPNVDVLAQFIRENVWGDAAPPDPME